MPRIRLSTTGRITLPRVIRTKLGWRPGTPLDLDVRDRALIIRRCDSGRDPDVPRTTIDDLLGCANYRGPRRSLREMEDAIRKGALGEE